LTLEYIAQIEVDADIALLKSKLYMRPICLRNLKISTILLKRCAAQGLTLAQIGKILCRPDNYDDSKQLSYLEKIVEKAEGSP